VFLAEGYSLALIELLGCVAGSSRKNREAWGGETGLGKGGVEVSGEIGETDAMSVSMSMRGGSCIG
jgi:hypothetical protein